MENELFLILRSVVALLTFLLCRFNFARASLTGLPLGRRLWFLLWSLRVLCAGSAVRRLRRRQRAVFQPSVVIAAGIRVWIGVLCLSSAVICARSSASSRWRCLYNRFMSSGIAGAWGSLLRLVLQNSFVKSMNLATHLSRRPSCPAVSFFRDNPATTPVTTWACRPRNQTSV